MLDSWLEPGICVYSGFFLFFKRNFHIYIVHNMNYINVEIPKKNIDYIDNT